jgi:tetratricopeptide (TPR) repeat protein
MRRFVFVLALIVVLAALPAQAQTLEELFDRGNAHFEARRYDSAKVCYAEALATGQESAALYFNLGNAYFRTGDLGRAILYYLRAQRLEPADDDIRANLEFAKRYTSIQMEGVRLNPVSSFFVTIVAPYNLHQLAWLASMCFVLLCVVLIVRYGFGRRGALLRAAITVGVTLLVVSSLLTPVKYNADYLTRRGVIVAEECTVRTGPSLSSETELEAVPGLIVEILDETGDFVNVLFENKRRGWIEKDLVAVI